MTTLCVITALSETLLRVLTEEEIRDSLLILTLPEIASKLRERKFSVVELSVESSQDQEDRDRQFASLALPGTVLDFPFPYTELQTWEVLSLDRLSFWHRGDRALKELEIVELLQWQKAIVTLDMHHPLPWSVAKTCQKRQIPCIGVEVEFMQTAEWGDLVMAGWLDCFDHLEIETRDTADMFIHWLFEAPMINWHSEPPVKKPISKEEKEGAKAGLGLENYLDITFVPWDLRVEHQIRGWLQKSEKKVLLWPVSPQAAEKLFLVGREIAEKEVVVVSDYVLHCACERMVAFRTDTYTYASRIPVLYPDDNSRTS